MKRFHTPLAVFTIALGSAALPALGASSAASSASEGASASVGSVSTSFETSSDSSSKKDKTASGDYKVIEVAEVAERPGTLRMKLQPVAQAEDADNSFFLYVPAQTLAQSQVAAGQIVAARQRPYGVEFAKGDTGKAFFLVLHDAWHRELQSNAVVL
ncbi:MAG: hypothetical protein H7Z15_19970 [Rhizobacter sp.]|nr:hypothetical protein [Rhizobacter sp.]